MRYVIAKLGTHSSQRILLLKGSLVVGSRVVFSEDGRRCKNAQQTGIVTKVNEHIVFIDRM